jgi:CheY-like chemotaxis protein
VWARNATDLHRVSRQFPVRAVIATSSQEDMSALRSSLHQATGVPIVSCPLTGPSSLQTDLSVVEYLTKPVVAERVASSLGRFRNVRNVLIVDDDPETVRMLGRMVRSLLRRVRVVGAYNGADALAAMQKVKPDVVFLDLMMPGVDGYAVLEYLRGDARLSDIPVIVVTANGKQSEEIMARSLTVSCDWALGAKELLEILRANLGAIRQQSGSTDPEPQGASAE